MFGFTTKKDLAKLREEIERAHQRKLDEALGPIRRDIQNLLSRIPSPLVRVEEQVVTLDQVVEQVAKLVALQLGDLVAEAVVQWRASDPVVQTDGMLSTVVANAIAESVAEDIDYKAVAEEVAAILINDDLLELGDIGTEVAELVADRLEINLR